MKETKRLLKELKIKNKELLERFKFLSSKRREFLKKYKIKLKNILQEKYDSKLEEIKNERKKIKEKIKQIEDFLEKSGEGRNPEVKEVVDYYIKLFEEKFKISPNINYKIDMPIAKKLLKKYDKETLFLLLKYYLELEDPFIKKSGYLFRLFPTSINSLIVKLQDLIKVSKIDEEKLVQIDKIQLDEYKKLKKEGKVTGKESWAQIFEEQLKNEGRN